MSEKTTPSRPSGAGIAASDALLKSATDAVEIAQKAGAQDAWASLSRDRSVSYTYRDGKIEKVEESTSRGLGISLYVDGRYSSHSTTDLRPDRLAAFIREAVALTRALQPDPHRKIPDPALFQGRPTVDLERKDPSLADLTPQQREAWCAEMDAAAHTDKRVISAESGLFSGESQGASASSNGFSGTWEGGYVGYNCTATVREGEDKRPEGSASAVGRFLAGLPEPTRIAEKALQADHRSPRQQEGPDDPHHHGRRSRGRDLADLPRARPGQRRRDPAGSLVLGRQARQPLFGDKLTITDEPLIPRGLGSRHFDGEGIAAKRMPRDRARRRQEPLRRHLLRPQARHGADHRLGVEPRRRARRQGPRRAARGGRQRHLRHLLARRQQRQHHRRLLARPARAPDRKRQDRRARSAR